MAFFFLEKLTSYLNSFKNYSAALFWFSSLELSFITLIILNLKIPTLKIFGLYKEITSELIDQNKKSSTKNYVIGTIESDKYSSEVKNYQIINVKN